MSLPLIEQRRRAEAHRPRTPDEVAAAARDMAARGFGDHTVAHVLNLDVAAVRRLIGDRHAAP